MKSVVAKTMIAPVISCIIPVHNGVRDLVRALSSALTQCPGVQVVLVDDASVDGSAELVTRLAQKDDRVTAVLLARNRGQGYARNVGVAAADAAYITFLDQDDEHLPGWYTYAINALEGNRGVAGVKGDIELVDIPTGVDVRRGDPRWRAMVNSVLWNVVMRKLLYSALGGCPTATEFRTRQGYEDINLMLAFVKHCQLATTSYVATRHYVQHDGATASYLARTRLVDGSVEHVEVTEVERDAGSAAGANEHANRAAINVRLLRELLRP